MVYRTGGDAWREEAWRRQDQRARWVMCFYLALIILVFLTARACDSEETTVVHAQDLPPIDMRLQADPAVLPSHFCHLESRTDWQAKGRVIRRGWDRDTGVLIFKLEHGCECLIYVPDWLRDVGNFPMREDLVFRGVTVGAPEKPVILMVLEVMEKT